MSDLPAWFDRTGQKQNQRSAAQERKRAKETGGRVQAGSGSSWRAPQDVVTDEHMEQIKYTDKAQYPLRATELQAVLADALRAGREPSMVIEFTAFGLRFVGEVEAI